MEELALQISILEQIKSRLYQEVAEINVKIKKIEFEMDLMRLGKFDAHLDKIMMAYDKKEQKLASIPEDPPIVKMPAGTPQEPQPEQIDEQPVVITKKEEPVQSGWLGGWWTSTGAADKIKDDHVRADPPTISSADLPAK